jgi:hypothetical protein
MRYRFRVLVVGIFFTVGCQQHPLTDYRPVDKAGMWSSNVEQLKKLNTSDEEIAQLVKLKQVGLSDDACLALVSAAHQHHHPFTSAEAAANLAGAGFAEPQILEIAQGDQLDTVSGDAVTLRLIGLSDVTVQTVLHRRLGGQPVLASAEISRLKNTGLSEQQILERINQGMTDEQAEREIKARETVRNHSGTGFVRIHGRTPR